MLEYPQTLLFIDKVHPLLYNIRMYVLLFLPVGHKRINEFHFYSQTLDHGEHHQYN